MKKNILPLMVTALLFGACSSEPVVVKKGEKFTFDEQEMSIDFTASSVLSNDEEKLTLIAPEGKVYLSVDITAQSDSYFLSVMDGETEIEEVDYMEAKPFVKKYNIGVDPNKNNLYLVDLNNDNYSIEIKSFGSDVATLKIGALKDNATLKVSDRMNAFVNEFKSGAGLIDVTKKYIKEGVDVYSVVFEEGSDVPMGPVTKGLKIRYISEDGTYTCISEFGIESMDVVWDGEYISKLTFKF